MKKRHGAEQIVAKLRQADVELGKGLKVPEVCKQMGVSEQTYLQVEDQVWRDGPADGQAVAGYGRSRTRG